MSEPLNSHHAMATWKIVHPLVLNIQRDLYVPSPGYIVKDIDQPLNGFILKRYNKEVADVQESFSTHSMDTINKEVALNIDLNQMLIKRRQRRTLTT